MNDGATEGGGGGAKQKGSCTVHSQHSISDRGGVWKEEWQVHPGRKGCVELGTNGR